jgi:plasmid stabilization system protein ParE
MATLRYADSANIDFIAALKAIRQYFDERESPELGEKHIELFKAELKRRELNLIQTPEFYPVRREYAESHFGRKYRTFNAHWFIVFYTYNEKEGIVIWYIRSSRSDYSDIIMLS